MYLFSRNAKAAPGKAMEAMGAAVEIGKKASAVSGLDIQTWTHHFGHPIGSVSWTCRVDSHADFYRATEKLAADASYVEMEQSMSDLIVEGEGDAFLEMIAGVPPETPAKFYTTTRATIVQGKLGEAMQWGAEITDYVLNSVGRSGAVLRVGLRRVLRRRLAGRPRLDRTGRRDAGLAGERRRVRQAGRRRWPPLRHSLRSQRSRGTHRLSHPEPTVTTGPLRAERNEGAPARMPPRC